jgi:hypothetical protein
MAPGETAILFTLLSSGVRFGFSTVPDLTFEAIITKTKYCQAGAGPIMLDLIFQLRSRTATPIPLVLPLFAQVSGYELFRDEAAARLNSAESKYSFHLQNVLDASKLDPSEPNPKLFRTLVAGQTAVWYGRVSIPISRARNTASLLGEDRYLRLHINPWPAKRRTGEKLRDLWQSRGLLWITEVVSLPIQIHIEREPEPSACWMQIA